MAQALVQMQVLHLVMVVMAVVVMGQQVQQLRQQVTLQQEQQILVAVAVEVFMTQVVEVDFLVHTLTVKQAALA